jgi:exosortase
MRIVAARYFLFSLDGWSIPVWVAGLVLLVGGWRLLAWSLPGIVFLLFMVPIPYTLESVLARPLQAISTTVSTFVLQCLQQPAIAVGNTILLGSETLEVARACSGMRIFVGVAALAYVFLVLFPRPWTTRILLAAAVLPIALIANSGRIVLTGLLYQNGYSEMARGLSHDLAGWVMIPTAIVLFGLVLMYLDRLFVAMQTIDSRSLARASLGS